MKTVFAGIFMSFAALSANAGGLDCRSGVDHKHPACYGRHAQVQYNHPHVQHRPYYNHGHHNYYAPAPVYIDRRGDWVAPLVGGVILGTVINNAVDRVDRIERIERVERVETTCSEWREVMQQNGTITRERTCWNR